MVDPLSYFLFQPVLFGVIKGVVYAIPSGMVHIKDLFVPNKFASWSWWMILFYYSFIRSFIYSSNQMKHNSFYKVIWAIFYHVETFF